jgi:hypothetical protein
VGIIDLGIQVPSELCALGPPKVLGIGCPAKPSMEQEIIGK